MRTIQLLVAAAGCSLQAWAFVTAPAAAVSRCHYVAAAPTSSRSVVAPWGLSSTAVEKAEDEMLDDKIISISDRALAHLLELKKSKGERGLVLRMGVRSGGCSGLSYVMDLVEEEEVTDEDMIEDYPQHGFKCAIDPKSMLYLYGLQLDYSDALIGGGFQFQNPNAESSCGCGKSFGV